ncbi:MAG TPA: glycosyltransferase [Ferruginibacter sp.]|nr:glycosyltransferase [Ferruginibacter sp.]HMP19968.1 glycosyltransferase [Ferruginibacter sp.]
MVAPLDWGLGHSTRCIPIVKELLANNCRVILAADGAAALLLRQEFPGLQHIHLSGYRVRYSRRKSLLPLTMLVQIPKILHRIYKEHRWLKKVVLQYNISGIIADNRFGLYHGGLPCIYITHQLAIQTGFRFTNWLFKKIHYWFIKKFSQCWVPDFAGEPNAAGKLSHPADLPAHVRYIGCISRFEKLQHPAIKYEVLVLLSGPEPQRSIFEAMLLKQLMLVNQKVLLVRGLPGNTLLPEAPGIDMVNHLPAPELNAAISSSNVIICRSGYTSIMDLLQMTKKAILVPTPGQTEQEYLAQYLTEKKIFLSQSQKGFSVLNSLQAAANFEYNLPVMDMEQYKTHVQQFVESL